MTHPLPDARQEMTCEDAEPLLPLIADGALAAADDPALFAHLARCASCQEALARHDLVDLALRRSFAERPARRLRLPRWAPLAAAAALVAAIGAAAMLAWPDQPAADAPAALAAGDAAAESAADGPPQIYRLPGRDARFLIVHRDGSTSVISPADGDAGPTQAPAPTQTVGW